MGATRSRTPPRGREGATDARAGLPAARTSFVGRQRLLADVGRHVSSDRLVTLVGPGGAGKTRVAVEAASTMTAIFPGGCVLADLSRIGDGALVTGAVAAAVGVHEKPGRDFSETIADALAETATLVVLDNCEHVLADAAAVVGTLLDRCACIRFLATSRQPLHVPGELAISVSEMELPEADAGADVVRGSEAVQLFADRAAAVRPDFSITSANAATVAEVCRQLDGLPLALELAAARVKVLTVEQIRDHLDERLAILSSSDPTTPARHRSLRATLDWSYEPLTDAQRHALSAVAVFPAGCAFEGLERVAELGAGELLDVVGDLVDRSLLTLTVAGDATRYRLLETVRQYVLEQLAPDRETSLRDVQAAWACELAAAAEPGMSGVDQPAWAALLAQEHDNVSAALQWTLDGAGDRVVGSRIAGRLWRYWHLRGHITEGRRWTDRAIAVESTDADRLRVLNAAGVMAWAQADYDEAERHHVEALALAERIGDERAVAVAASNLSAVLQLRGDVERAAVHVARAVDILTALGDERTAAYIQINLGGLAYASGDAARARLVWESALRVLRRTLHSEGVAHALNNLASLALAEGDLHTAEAQWDEAERLFREHDNPHGRAHVLANLGGVYSARGDARGGTVRILESVSIYRELGDRLGLASSLESLAGPATTSGDRHRAAYALGVASSLREQIGATPPAPDDARNRELAAALRAVDEASFDRSFAAGRAADLDFALDTIAAGQPAAPTPGEHRFVLEGEYWSITFGADVLRLRDMRGLQYLARLISRPGVEMLAADLVAGKDPVRARLLDRRAEPLADPEAREAYRRRLADLRDELAEAEAFADDARRTRAAEELQALEAELVRLTGLGGRARRSSSEIERARVAVTKAVRTAQRKIAAASPDLAAHLRATVRTGTFCSYTPDPESAARWTVVDGTPR